MRGFVVLAGGVNDVHDRAVVQAVKGAAGWARILAAPDLVVHVRGPRPPAVWSSPAGDLVLIGDLFDPSGALARVPVEWSALTAADLCRRLSSDFWGRYIALVRRGGVWSAFRDPSGALDAFAWRRSGVAIFANTAPRWLEAALPESIEPDDDQLSMMLAAPTGMVGASALRGLTALAPGAISDGVTTAQVWSPAQVYSRGLIDPADAARALRGAVTLATRALCHGSGGGIVEISGGLDSAIVAGVVDQQRVLDVACWLNLYIDEPLGDERRFARAVADRMDADLTVVEKLEGRFRTRRPACQRLAFRPPIGGQDVVYDDIVSELAVRLGADRLLSGQGGDTVFLQVAHPDMAQDLLRDRGPAGLFGRDLVDLARWTRRSVWSQARAALRRPGPAVADGFRPAAFVTEAVRSIAASRAPHPWLADLDPLPPAKRFQVQGLALMQRLVGATHRAQQVDEIYPLLAQPVVEAALRISAIDLTRGGCDRGLARLAFADLIPDVVRLRRTKGDGTGYFSRIVERSLPALRGLLLDGELARRGLIDRACLEAMLTPDYLVVDGLYPEFLDAAIIELWVREWSEWAASRRAAAILAAAS